MNAAVRVIDVIVTLPFLVAGWVYASCRASFLAGAELFSMWQQS